MDGEIGEKARDRLHCIEMVGEREKKRIRCQIAPPPFPSLMMIIFLGLLISNKMTVTLRENSPMHIHPTPPLTPFLRTKTYFTYQAICFKNGLRRNSSALGRFS